MERLPAGGTAELATKADFQLLRDEIRVLEYKVDGVEQRLRAEMSAELGGLRAEMSAEIGGLRTEMGGMRAEMHRMGRSITVTLLTVMALFNGMLFAALKLT